MENDSEDLSENFSTCPVCYVKFDDEENKPKILSCGHTTCLQCLKVLKALILENVQNNLPILLVITENL